MRDSHPQPGERPCAVAARSRCTTLELQVLTTRERIKPRHLGNDLQSALEFIFSAESDSPSIWTTFLIGRALVRSSSPSEAALR